MELNYIHLSTFFLLLQCFLTALYLVRKERYAHIANLPTATAFGGTVLAILVISSVFTWFLGAEFFLLSVSLAIGVVLSTFHPVAALGFFASVLFLRPWEFVEGDSLLLLLPKGLAILSLVSWLFYKFRTRALELRWNRTVQLFVLLLVWFVTSCAFSATPADSLDYLFERLFPSAVLLLLVIHAVDDRTDLSHLFASVVFAVTGVIVSALVYTSEIAVPGQIGGRLVGPGLLGNSNDLASIIVLVIPLLVQETLRKRRGSSIELKLGSIVFHLMALALLVVGLWLTQSRGALLALFCGGLLFAVSSGLKKKSQILPGLLLALVPIALSFFVFRAEGDLDASSSSRWNYVIAGINMTKHHPLFGVGIGRYPEMYEMYTPSFEEWGKRTAHSSWILVLSEAGVPALLFFAALFAINVLACWRVRQLAPGMLVSIVGYGITITFLSHSYLFVLYFLLGMSTAAARVLSRAGNIPVETDSRKPRSYRRPQALLPVTSLCLLCCLSLPTHVQAQEALIQASVGLQKPLGDTLPRLQKKIRLSGARGEMVFFQLYLTGRGCQALRVEGFEQLSLKLFRMETITTKYPSFPGAYVGEHYDPLVPLTVGKPVCPSSKGLWILGEISIPENLPPAAYQGTFTYGLVKLPVEINVWKMTLPNKPPLPIYTEMSTWYNLVGHYGKWTNGEADLAKQYLALLRRHRVQTLTTHIDTPVVQEVDGKERLNLRTTPTAEQSFYRLNIEGRPEWAYLGYPTMPHERALEPKTYEYFRAVSETIRSEKLPYRPMVYLWDEPQTEDLPKLRAFAHLVKKAAPNLRVMVTMTYKPEFHDLIDIYVPVADFIGTNGFPDFDTYRKLQRDGKEVWWYVSCMSHGCDALADTGIPDLVIDRPSSYVRSIGWLGAKQGIDAFLYYFVNFAYQFYPDRDPWKNQWDFSGNGDGTLVYPGRPGMFGLTAHTPLPSYRLKLLLETSQDAQYVQWMKEQKETPEWWNSELEKLVPGLRTWERQYESYSALRERVGNYLHSLGGS